MKNKMADMFKQAQKLQQQMLKAQEELVNIKVEGTSGGGMVKVTANAKQEILSIKIEKATIEELAYFNIPFDEIIMCPRDKLYLNWKKEQVSKLKERFGSVDWRDNDA